MSWNKPTKGELLAALDKWERLTELGIIDYMPEFARGLVQDVMSETSALLEREFGKKVRRG